MIWISLSLFGLILYFIVHYRVSRTTTTPTWALWLVLMLPALVVGGWAAVYGEKADPPPQLLIPCTLMSLFLYLYLVRPSIRPTDPKPPTDDHDTEAEAIQGEEAALPKPLPPPNLLTKEEESQLQSCFPWSIFYLQNVDARPQVVICRGQLRSQPNTAYQTIQKNIQTQFGHRFLVVFQAGAQNKPFFVLVPNPQAQERKVNKAPLNRPGLAFSLLVCTVLTTAWAGLRFSDGEITRQILRSQPQLLAKGLPYAIALVAILGLHELGHYFTARYYRIKASLPYFVPMPWSLFPIGTLGAFVQTRSPYPNRKALFDVGIAGPLAGLVITIPILIVGLMQSTVVAIPDKLQGLPVQAMFKAMDPSSSILFSLFSRLILGSELTLGQGIDLHPFAIAGWIGLIVTALNLMPIGQLDGGHIVHAMFGQRNGAIIGQISRLLVLLLAFVQRPLLLWAIVLLFMPTVDQPALNDVSELDNTRDFLGLIALGLLVMIILPLPHSLAHLLFAANPLP